MFSGGRFGFVGVYLEDFLYYLVVVFFEGYFVGFGGVDADEVGVVFVSFFIIDVLEEDLDEAEVFAVREETVF